MRRFVGALIAAVAIGGCGGGSSGLSGDEYAAKLREILTPLGSGLQTLSNAAASAQSKAQLEMAIQGGEKAIQTAIDDLEPIEAPSEAGGANDELVTALGDYEDSLKATEGAVAKGSATEIRNQVATFRADSRVFVSTLTNLRQQLLDAGIDVRAAP